MQVLGIYSGKIDGVIGIRTQATLKNWQEKNGMTPSGVIDTSVVKRLEKAAGGRLAQIEKKRAAKAKRLAELERINQFCVIIFSVNHIAKLPCH